MFKLDDWQVIGEYVYGAEGGRHQAWYSPVRDTWALGQHIPAGERVFVERSVKYSKSETRKLWEAAGMVEAGKWSVGEEYGECGFGYLVSHDWSLWVSKLAESFWPRLPVLHRYQQPNANAPSQKQESMC